MNENFKRKLKKLITATVAMTLVVGSVMAQGFVNGLNGGTSALIQVMDLNYSKINNGNPAVVGTAANSAGFYGAGPGQVTIELFIAPNGTSFDALTSETPYLTVANSSSTLAAAQGTIAYPSGSGNPLVLPVGPAYNGSQPVEFIFYGSTTGGEYQGWSSEGVITPATGTAVAPALFGTGPGQISSFILMDAPEPTTIALGSLGTAALLFFRRRK